VNRIIRAAEALGVRKPRNVRSKLAKLAALLMALAGLWLPESANAALSSASVALTDPEPGVTSSYNFTASNASATVVNCVEVDFSNNADGSGGVPSGMTTTSAVLNASSTLFTSTNLTKDSSAANGSVVYSDSTGHAAASGSGKTYNLDTITNANPVSTTSYWMTFKTTNNHNTTNHDCSGGTTIDVVTVGFVIQPGQQLSLTVNPTLTFSVTGQSASTVCNGVTTTTASSGNNIALGVPTPAANTSTCQHLVVSSNSTHGYSVYIRDTAEAANQLAQKLADYNAGSSTPSAWTTAGAEGYGFTTSNSSVSGFSGSKFEAFQGGGSRTNSSANNVLVGTNSASVYQDAFDVAFQSGVSTTTLPGTYTTTVVYTCTPVY
jgi:hypothetical protein